MDTTDHSKQNVVFDAGKIDAVFPMATLSRTWGREPPFVLDKIDHIAADMGKVAHGWVGSFKWFDPRAGKGGSGATSLVAHVLKIEPKEAARRLVEFYCTQGGVTHETPRDDFLKDRRDA